MTNVELMYNPYTNKKHIKVNEKSLDEIEVKEYVGTGRNVCDWAMNFWERISIKCNDDFTVHFCGLESDYIKISQAFCTFKKNTTYNVCLEPDYVINPIRINNEQYVKNELEIIFGKKIVINPNLNEYPDGNYIKLEDVVSPEKKLLDQLRAVYSSKPGSSVDFGKITWEVCVNYKNKVFLVTTMQKYNSGQNNKITYPFANMSNHEKKISIGEIKKEFYNYLNTEFLESIFSEEERKYLIEHHQADSQSKVFIPAIKEVLWNGEDKYTLRYFSYLGHKYHHLLFEDGWISKNGNLMSYKDPDWNSMSLFVIGIIVDTSHFHNKKR